MAQFIAASLEVGSWRKSVPVARSSWDNEDAEDTNARGLGRRKSPAKSKDCGKQFGEVVISAPKTKILFELKKPFKTTKEPFDKGSDSGIPFTLNEKIFRGSCSTLRPLCPDHFLLGSHYGLIDQDFSEVTEQFSCGDEGPEEVREEVLMSVPTFWGSPPDFHETKFVPMFTRISTKGFQKEVLAALGLAASSRESQNSINSRQLYPGNESSDLRRDSAAEMPPHEGLSPSAVKNPSSALKPWRSIRTTLTV